MEFSRYLVEDLPKNSFVFGVSNSGTVSRTIEGVRLAREKGAWTFAVTVNAGSNDIFGGTRQQLFLQSAIADLTLYRGDTVFKPPDFQFRITPVFNYNYAKVEDLSAINIDPREGVFSVTPRCAVVVRDRVEEIRGGGEQL